LTVSLRMSGLAGIIRRIAFMKHKQCQLRLIRSSAH
jgi:hypothetical protein